MFGWGLVLITVLVMTYVAWRATSVPWLIRRLQKQTLWITFAGLWVLMALGRTLGHSESFPGTAPGSALLEITSMTLLGVLFLCFVSLLAVDLATGFGFWCRPSSPRLRGWALVGGLGLSGIALVQGMRAPEIVDYEVPIPGLPQERDGLVVVALSDLHLGASIGPRWMKARIAQVHALHPDLILLLGDVFEGHGRPDEDVMVALRTLRAPMGVWGVDGNHERHGNAASPLDEAGVHVLRNALGMPIPGLVLAGRTGPGQRVSDPGSTWQVPSERPKGALVLMAHIPRQVEEAAQSGVGLMLSGHTHGGQLWPFGYLTGMAFPVLSGKVQIGEMTLIVNRGAGTWGPRMRLWRRGEISRIRLRSVYETKPF